MDWTWFGEEFKYRWPLLCLGAVAASDVSRGLPCPVRDRDRSPLDPGAGWWQPPTTQADCLGCGSDGSSNDRSPRSRRSNDDDRAWIRAGDNLRTIGRPFAGKA